MSLMSVRGRVLPRTLQLGAVASIGTFAFAAHLPAAQQAAPSPVPQQERFFVVPEGTRPAVLHESGETIDVEWNQVWKGVCSNQSVLTSSDLSAMARRHAAAMETGPIVVVDAPQMIGSFNVVYNVSGSIPAGALAAIAAAETYIESNFSDPITITVNLSFANLGAGVLGGTGSAYGSTSWASSRAGLVAGMDASDTIQTSLPSGTTIPVRYGSGATVTNENRVFWTLANFNATVGTVAGTAANMQYNNAFTWDFDPSNGITAGTYSFVDVVIHETGHAMGFTSGIDFRVNDIEALDVYRFQRTDGSSDYNPDTLAEFTARPRIMAFNSPNDAHNSDLISAEFRMSDGSPWQGSHFREQSPNIGIMDPAFAAGETWFPAYYSSADTSMFDAIGYDR